MGEEKNYQTLTGKKIIIDWEQAKADIPGANVRGAIEGPWPMVPARAEITHWLQIGGRSVGIDAANFERMRDDKIAAGEQADARIEQACPGYSNLCAARKQEAQAHDALEAMIARGDGIHRGPHYPKPSIAECEKSYPRAALLLRAKMEIGRAQYGSQKEAWRECERLLLAGAKLSECEAASQRELSEEESNHAFSM